MISSRARQFWLQRVEGVGHEPSVQVAGFVLPKSYNDQHTEITTSKPQHSSLLITSSVSTTSTDRTLGNWRLDNRSAVTSSSASPTSSLESFSSHLRSVSSSPRRHRICRRSQAEEIIMTPPQPATHGMPRRYVSGVRMEVKPVPFRYSSSVHLTVGSTKRRYTEKVFYKMRLVPYGYFEGATADFCHVPNPGARRFIATMTLQCTNIPHVKLMQPDEDTVDTDA